MIPRVLIIDDEADWQETFKDIFTSAGCEADSAADISSAKELLKADTYRLIILDIFLSPAQAPLNYQSFLIFITRTYPDIIVVAVTGKPLAPDEAFALSRLGVSDFIYKPRVHLDDMRGLAHRILGLEGMETNSSRSEANRYDVFLCYNSPDKEQVKAIGQKLRERGIRPWLDEWDIRPGSRWQDTLKLQLKSIGSAAVFIGPRGGGPWQDLEIQELLRQFTKHKRPIIPVILEGRKGRPRLPGFLGLWHVVDMRLADPDPIDQLMWGITGEKKSSNERLLGLR